MGDTKLITTMSLIARVDQAKLRISQIILIYKIVIDVIKIPLQRVDEPRTQRANEL